MPTTTDLLWSCGGWRVYLGLDGRRFAMVTVNVGRRGFPQWTAIHADHPRADALPAIVRQNLAPILED